MCLVAVSLFGAGEASEGVEVRCLQSGGGERGRERCWGVVNVEEGRREGKTEVWWW